jgi:hypothetical protein
VSLFTSKPLHLFYLLITPHFPPTFFLLHHALSILLFPSLSGSSLAQFLCTVILKPHVEFFLSSLLKCSCLTLFTELLHSTIIFIFHISFSWYFLVLHFSKLSPQHSCQSLHLINNFINNLARSPVNENVIC